MIECNVARLYLVSNVVIYGSRAAKSRRQLGAFAGIRKGKRNVGVRFVV